MSFKITLLLVLFSYNTVAFIYGGGFITYMYWNIHIFNPFRMRIFSDTDEFYGAKIVKSHQTILRVVFFVLTSHWTYCVVGLKSIMLGFNLGWLPVKICLPSVDSKIYFKSIALSVGHRRRGLVISACCILLVASILAVWYCKLY